MLFLPLNTKQIPRTGVSWPGCRSAPTAKSKMETLEDTAFSLNSQITSSIANTSGQDTHLLPLSGI